VKPASTPWCLLPKETWRDSLSTDMLLSAVLSWLLCCQVRKFCRDLWITLYSTGLNKIIMMANGKRFGRRWPWTITWYYHGVHLKANGHETSVRRAGNQIQSSCLCSCRQVAQKINAEMLLLILEFKKKLCINCQQITSSAIYTVKHNQARYDLINSGFHFTCKHNFKQNHLRDGTSNKQNHASLRTYRHIYFNL
jgi:hypothetical protein